MAEAEVSLDSLTASQQEALQQYTAVTDQDVQAAIGILQRCQWNVQIAITRFFDGEPAEPVAEVIPDAPAPQDIRRQEVLLNEIQARPATLRGPQVQAAPRVVPQPESQMSRQAPLILTVLLTPFHILVRLLSPFFRVFARLFPFLPRMWNSIFASRNSSSRKPLSPRDTAARTIRELEEEFGSNTLPFEETGYAQAFDTAKRELKYLVVVLLSSEHDDTSYFVRHTLLATNVVDFLRDPSNNVMLWLGNVADPEAYQVSTALRVSKLPFTGLIVHTPSVSSTAMSVIARIPGTTAPGPYIAKLRKAIAENNESLSRARAVRAEQQAARNLREQQNSAYERSLAQDRARAQKKREEEERKKAEEEEATRREREQELYNTNLEQWRQWRAQRLQPEPSADVKDAVRINIRMPSGERVMRKFAADVQLEELYALVECHDVIEAGLPDEKVEKPEGFTFEYSFRLVSPMPREEYSLEKGGTIKERIGRSGSLIVEPLVEAEDDDSDDDDEALNEKI